MQHPSEEIRRRQALASYHGLIGQYRKILTVRSNSRDGNDTEAVIGRLLQLVDGPDWRAVAELRHEVFGLKVPNEAALEVALKRIRR